MPPLGILDLHGARDFYPRRSSVRCRSNRSEGKQRSSACRAEFDRRLHNRPKGLTPDKQLLLESMQRRGPGIGPDEVVEARCYQALNSI